MEDREDEDEEAGAWGELALAVVPGEGFIEEADEAEARAPLLAS